MFRTTTRRGISLSRKNLVNYTVAKKYATRKRNLSDNQQLTLILVNSDLSRVAPMKLRFHNC